MEAGSGTPGNRRRSPRLSGRPQRQQRQELSQSLLVRKVALAIASDVPLGDVEQYTTNLSCDNYPSKSRRPYEKAGV